MVMPTANSDAARNMGAAAFRPAEGCPEMDGSASIGPEI
jgi:hypothetical protein